MFASLRNSSVRLMDDHSGRKLYDRELKDVFAVQAEIAKSVAEQMKVKLLGERQQSDAAPSDQNLAAHNAVLQADFYLQQLTPESVRRAIQFLEEAVRLDPNYALAYAKLSQAWRQIRSQLCQRRCIKAYEEARRTAENAVSLAPDLADVRMAVGFLAFTPDLDFRAAEKEFRHVLEYAPNHAAAKSLSRRLALGARSTGRSRANLPGSCVVRPSRHQFLVQHWTRCGGTGPLQGSGGTVS